MKKRRNKKTPANFSRFKLQKRPFQFKVNSTARRYDKPLPQRSPPQLRNNKGQGLVEYLILVALMAVACIGVLRSINQVVNAKFTEVDYALRGDTVKVKKDSIDLNLSKKRDLSNFMRGAGTHEKK